MLPMLLLCIYFWLSRRRGGGEQVRWHGGGDRGGKRCVLESGAHWVELGWS